jgi:hypothetical protein
MSLFKNIGIQRVLDYLDEKTSIREDVSIFSKLPWQPFVSALFRKLSHSGIFRPVMLTLLSLLIFLLDFNPELQSVVGYGLLLFGLVTIGIPHGAVDHLLESGKWEFRKAPAFIVKYMAWAAAMAGLWLVAPGVALVLFLLYSSLHFGQADGKLWQLNRSILIKCKSVPTCIKNT